MPTAVSRLEVEATMTPGDTVGMVTIDANVLLRGTSGAEVGEANCVGRSDCAVLKGGALVTGGMTPGEAVGMVTIVAKVLL